jgi:hypothetical protein
MKTKNPLSELSEQQLLGRFAELVHADRVNTAQLLVYMAEIDERKLWAKHACSSMFALCIERFHMSESMTAKRIWAARTARRFPAILTMVARGELHLSGINQLGKHLTEENHRTVLERARHKSSREIDILVAELAPRPDVPSRVRALPRSDGSGVGRATSAGFAGEIGGPREQRAPASLSGAPPDLAGGLACAAGSAGTPGPTAAPQRSATRKQIVALAPKRFKIEVDQETHDKLRSLQDLLRQQLPSTEPAAIVSRAIALLLDETLKKKAALTETPRPGHASHTGGRTRAIPAVIRRQVWRRDAGRCTFVDEQGRRCRETSSIEYHHKVPYGKGGRHEAGNLELHCRAHNQYQADLDFGCDFMVDRRRGLGPHSARHVPRMCRGAGIGVR